jgi:hypothetical protein
MFTTEEKLDTNEVGIEVGITLIIITLKHIHAFLKEVLELAIQ